MSAARLAAEAAFAAPLPLSASPERVQVTVRRARLAAPVAEPAAVDDTRPAIEPTRKAPRVFTLEAAQAPRQPDTPLGVQSLPLPPASPAASIRSDAPATGARARIRRIAVDKRPGPVLHVLQSVPRQTRQAETTPPRLATLIDELARVGPVLESIAQAQSFRFIDDRFAMEWQQISQRADDLQMKLNALLR